jgi:hypothetical protein
MRISIAGLAGVALLAVSGCSSHPTMETLYDQALATGDWSSVEHRERKNASRAALSACLQSNGREYCIHGDCKCVPAKDIERWF